MGNWLLINYRQVLGWSKNNPMECFLSSPKFSYDNPDTICIRYNPTKDIFETFCQKQEEWIVTELNRYHWFFMPNSICTELEFTDNPLTGQLLYHYPKIFTHGSHLMYYNTHRVEETESE